jgi:hypothetical protein
LTPVGDIGADVNKDEALLTGTSAHCRPLDQGNPLRRWLWIEAMGSSVDCSLAPLNALAQATAETEASTDSNQG